MLLIRAEDNDVVNALGSGVSVCAEESGKEGVTPANVTIRRNWIRGAPVAVDVGVSAPNPTTVGLNRGIRVEDNRIESGPDQATISIRCAQDISIRNNHITGGRPITIAYSRNVGLANNGDACVEVGPEVSIITGVNETTK
jgi:hypothetical protein